MYYNGTLKYILGTCSDYQGVHVLGPITLPKIVSHHRTVRVKCLPELAIQWNLTNPNSLGPELVQISEIFGLMKQYI